METDRESQQDRTLSCGRERRGLPGITGNPFDLLRQIARDMSGLSS